MSIVALLVIVIAVVPAFGLAAWVWLTIASETETEEAYPLMGYKGVYLERRTGPLTRTGVDKTRGHRLVPNRLQVRARKFGWGESLVFSANDDQKGLT